MIIEPLPSLNLLAHTKRPVNLLPFHFYLALRMHEIKQVLL